MFYSLLFSLFSVVSSYMISGGVGTAVSSLLARFFTVGKPRLVVVAVQGAPDRPYVAISLSVVDGTCAELARAATLRGGTCVKWLCRDLLALLRFVFRPVEAVRSFNVAG